MKRSSKLVRKYRKIAENLLKRKLLPGEIVHHIDGNPENNTFKNLRIMKNSEHTLLHMKKRGACRDIVFCAVCGNKLIRPRNKVRRNKKNYCNRKCLNIAKPFAKVPGLTKQELTEKLKQANWNMSEVGRQLGISCSAIRKRIKAFDI